MSRNSGQPAISTAVLYPEVGECYSHGWNQMWKHILELALILIINLLISIPASGMSAADEIGGFFGFYLFIFSLAYAVMIVGPVEYGVAYAFLKAVRSEKVEIKDMFEVFKNYVNAVLANILTNLIIGVGFLFFIVPGIIFACKLVFVPYLIVEERMDAVEAIKQSWRKTDGHAMTVFLMGLLAIPIFMLGLVLCGVGVLLSVIWTELAFAAIYYAVCQSARSQKPAVAIS